MGVEEHRRHSPKHVGFAVISVSDSRTPETDETGHLLQEMMTKAGHREGFYLVVKDRMEEIQGALFEACQAEGVEVVVFNGGTGVAPRDVTIEALSPLMEKVLPGFGEIFRFLSYQEIGSAAILSRALAGTYDGHIVIALPGSPAAARLAMEKIILPEMGHLVREVRR